MTASPRMRSLLYTPADRPERYTKAWREGAADIVAADLEDAVAPANKQAARKAVVAALKEVPRGATLRAVRINAPDTPAFAADLDAVLAAGPDLIILPKVESPEQIVRLLARIEREAVGATRLIAILETARGIVNAREICAVPSLAAVCFGAEDLSADVGMRRSPESREVMAARQWVVLCAAAAGIPALDMITPDIRDLERTAREAREARDWGFSGKMCIHPTQAAAIHEAFRPSPEELAWARKVLAAVEKAGIGAGGVVEVEGRMIDVPVIRQARRILADAT
ncbi:MAG: CoA ester lyase [Candidatus Thermoplasmatota archaeon]